MYSSNDLVSLSYLTNIDFQSSAAIPRPLSWSYATPRTCMICLYSWFRSTWCRHVENRHFSSCTVNDLVSLSYLTNIGFQSSAAIPRPLSWSYATPQTCMICLDSWFRSTWCRHVENRHFSSCTAVMTWYRCHTLLI